MLQRMLPDVAFGTIAYANPKSTRERIIEARIAPANIFLQFSKLYAICNSGKNYQNSTLLHVWSTFDGIKIVCIW